MLNINLKRVFALRGISNPQKFLVKGGFTRPTAWNLLNNNTTLIRSKQLELLCELLNCEPNDLYEWKPDKGTKDVSTHPLRALLRTGKTPQYKEMIDQLPLDKLDKVEEMLTELGSSE